MSDIEAIRKRHNDFVSSHLCSPEHCDTRVVLDALDDRTVADMQAIARQAAIGAAVERLPQDYYWTIEHTHGEKWVFEVMRSDGDIFTADTLPEAIAAALGEEADLVEPPSEALWSGVPRSRWEPGVDMRPDPEEADR